MVESGGVAVGMLLIAGTYRIVGAAPDGDSVRFYPDDPSQWDLVAGAHQVRATPSAGRSCGWMVSARWKPITPLAAS
jgi:hypothetical protein